jgi:hypothetical protein
MNNSMSCCFPNSGAASRAGASAPTLLKFIVNWPHTAHLTLQLLWEEYREVHPAGYGYSRFCELYHEWKRTQDVVLGKRCSWIGRVPRFRFTIGRQDIDYQHPRGLDRKLIRSLASSEWVRQKQNILLLGPTGIGKSWLGCALAHQACRDGFSAWHKRFSELFRDLAVAHADGSFGRMLLKLSRVDVLLLDDFAMAPPQGQRATRLAGDLR